MKRAPLVKVRLNHSSDDLPAIAGGIPTRSRERRLIFGAPVIGEAEIASVTECLRSRWIGLGAKVEQFEGEFASYKGAPFAAAVSSGTAAIHLSLVALEIGLGDEVIAPAMTFCSTIHSIVHTGARPVLVDCGRDTFNLDPQRIEERITPRTKAILAVHMCGRCCEMAPILEIARRHDLRVIEDCAHAIEAHYQGRPAGLLGDLGCFSFYPTKNITTGDGGMVITHDRDLFEQVKILSLHGMTADAWSRFSGGPPGYEVIAAGFKYNMTDLEASLGLPQLRQIEERWQQRERVWLQYIEELQGLPLLLPPLPEPGTRHAYHLFTPLLVLEELSIDREGFLAALDAENIGAGIHYVPVHQQPYYRRRFGFAAQDYPAATFVGERTVSLPLSPELSADDIRDVATAMKRIIHYYSA
jgi:dTDP-4-amino-4,6-dideoxygalactose transaminase